MLMNLDRTLPEAMEGQRMLQGFWTNEVLEMNQKFQTRDIIVQISLILDKVDRIR